MYFSQENVKRNPIITTFFLMHCKCRGISGKKNLPSKLRTVGIKIRDKEKKKIRDKENDLCPTGRLHYT